MFLIKQVCCHQRIVQEYFLEAVNDFMFISNNPFPIIPSTPSETIVKMWIYSCSGFLCWKKHIVLIKADQTPFLMVNPLYIYIYVHMYIYIYIYICTYIYTYMKIDLCSSAAPCAFHLTSGSAAAYARNKTQHSPIAERIHHSESILIYIYIYIFYIYTYIEKLMIRGKITIGLFY